MPIIKPGSIINNGFWTEYPDNNKVLLNEEYGFGSFVGNLHVLEAFNENIFVVYFTEEGIGKEGLTPEIILFKSVDTGLDILPVPEIVEISGGFYKFVYNPTVDIVVKIDGGEDLLDSERYKSFKISPVEKFGVGNTGLL